MDVFPKRYLYKEIYPLAISLQLGLNNIPVEEVSKYVTIHLEISELDLSEAAKGDAHFNVVHYFTFRSCKELADKTLITDFLNNHRNLIEKQFFEEYMLCPDFDNSPKELLEELYALANPMTPPYRKIDLRVYPCSLTN